MKVPQPDRRYTFFGAKTAATFNQLNADRLKKRQNNFRLIGSGRAAHALETMRNGCFSSRLLVFGDPRRKNNFKVIHALPMPIRATLPNAAIKYRLSQGKPPVKGGSVHQRPRLKTRKS